MLLETETAQDAADQIAALKLEVLYWKELAQVDHLTGLQNRRRFDEALEEEWQRSLRHQTALTLIFVDVDHLKALNAQYGHVGANDLLTKIGDVLNRFTARAGDLAFRFGGDELAVLLPQRSHQEALDFAEAVRQAVAAIGCTVSQGVATMTPTEATTWRDLAEQANQQMYLAKADGRNCVR